MRFSASLSSRRHCQAAGPPKLSNAPKLKSTTALLLRGGLLGSACGLGAACSSDSPQILITIADARVEKAQVIDLGEPGDSVGDVLVFDQPLLDEHGNSLGNNSGVCIRTRVEHSFQCQWTLTLDDGSIQVAGRELDRGTSSITIVGGTGVYSGITGHMDSTNNGDGTFTQTLHYRTP